MPRFALRYPYFIVMVCLVIMVVGITSIAGMPVDLFPKIDIPVAVVATLYSGMPPQQIEADRTDTFERFFSPGSNIDHIESRSLTFGSPRTACAVLLSIPLSALMCPLIMNALADSVSLSWSRSSWSPPYTWSCMAGARTRLRLHKRDRE